MSSYIPPFIGPAGLSVPAYADIVNYLQEQFKAIYGQDVYLGNDSADFQFIALIALLVQDNMNLAQLLYNNRSPSFAVGAALDSLVKINGLYRKVASFSTAAVTLTGTPGTTITNGVVTDVNGNKWNLPVTVLIGGSGTVITVATAQVTGLITAAIGQINGIATPTAGWTSVTNAAAASPGQPVESDSQLRARQAVSTELPSITMLTGTIAAIAEVSGVTRYNVVENPTSGVDALGNPPHSITAVVEGGADVDVATAIYNNKGIGCFTNGSSSVVLTDPVTGIPSTISFSRPGPVPIFVIIPIHPLSASYNTAMQNAILAAVLAYLNSLEIGELVTQSGIIAAALSVVSNISNPPFSIRGLTLGTAPAPGGTADVAILFNQVAQGVVGNVSITAV